MGFFQEFKGFVSRGNVVDLAVGVIIGGAFGKIVSSAVGDVIMPPVGLLLGRVNFTDLKLVISGPLTAGKPPVTINYGNFLQNSLDFLIVSAAVFLMIQLFNRLKRQIADAPPPGHVPSAEEKLLTEIRDLLKERAPGDAPRTGVTSPTPPDTLAMPPGTPGHTAS